MKTYTHNLVNCPKLKQITNEDGVRKYVTPEGNHYESVTTFISRLSCKKKLFEWQKRIGHVAAKKETVRTQVRGKSVHSLVETYVRNKPLDLTNPLSKQLFVRIRPVVERIDNLRVIESALYSNRLKLAGTPDIIGDFDDVLSVIDVKTSTKMKQKKAIMSYYLQTACYAIFFEEHFEMLPQQAVILMVSEEEPEPKVFIEPIKGCIKALEAFIENPVEFNRRIAA